MNPDGALKDLRLLLSAHDLEALLARVGGYTGDIKDMRRISGGLVHFVYRVEGVTDVVYMKIRGRYFAEVPTIDTDPARIRDEFVAYQLLSPVAQEHIPEVILFDSALHCLVVREAFPNCRTLADAYATAAVSLDVISALATALAQFHLKASRIQQGIRSPDDTIYRDQSLYYVFRRYDDPILNRLAQEHQIRPQQIIFGDPSPKNILIDGNKICFCDLENAHRSTTVYDVGYLLAHILLHDVGEGNDGVEAGTTFLTTYAQHAQLDEDSLLWGTAYAVLLYRLDNEFIPYNLPKRIAPHRTTIVPRVVSNLTNSQDHTLEQIVNALRGSLSDARA